MKNVTITSCFLTENTTQRRQAFNDLILKILQYLSEKPILSDRVGFFCGEGGQ